MGRFPQDLRPAGRLHRQITVCPFDPLGPVLPGSFGLSAPFSSSCLLGPFGLLRQKFVVCISGSPYRTVAVKQTVVFRPPLMGRCRNAKSGAVCRQRASRQASQKTACAARPKLPAPSDEGAVSEADWGRDCGMTVLRVSLPHPAVAGSSLIRGSRHRSTNYETHH